MQGTILIIDGVATNRIMLKVQMSAAYYHVVQTATVDGLAALARRTRPDLVMTAMGLPDGTALDVRAELQADESLAGIPVIAITAENDRNARLRALEAGIDDVLSQPLDDMLLQARIRSLLRSRSSAEDLHLSGTAPTVLGLSESAAGFAAPDRVARVALVTSDAATGTRWRNALRTTVPHRLECHKSSDATRLMSESAPDAVVIQVNERDCPGLRLLADLRTRSTTRHAAIIAVIANADPSLAAEALDRGAHDVMQTGFCPDELGLRLSAQLRRKASSDRLRDTVRNGLQAAVTDPLTGLYNRRFALPHLSRLARMASGTGRSFAVMLADLDHFKRINDQFGHPAGDAVLIETSKRLSAGLRSGDMIARVGGEEFMIVLEETDSAEATDTANRLCRRIESTPFTVPGIDRPIAVTISIGVVVCPGKVSDPRSSDLPTTALIGQADRALYVAKDAGRNQVTLFSSAA